MSLEKMNDYQESILFDGHYLTSLISDINIAKKSIFLETYKFEHDEAGAMLTDALCNAAKRGVLIKVLVDGIGSIDWGNSLTGKLHDAKIKTRIYHPLPWLVWHWRHAAHVPTSIIYKVIYLISKINSRNHRKICVIDKNIVYIGSANITNHLIKKENALEYWRETSVKLTNINTNELSQSQEKAWSRFSPIKKIKMLFSDNTDSIFKLNDTWKKRRLLYKALLKRLSFSKEKIWVTSAYFTPEYTLLKTLIRASKRGVDVKILLPQISDVKISSLAASMFYKKLLANKVTILEYTPAMLHAKSIIIDNYHQIGSSNLNYRSLHHDLEIDASITHEASKRILSEQFLQDMSHAQQISLDDIKKVAWYKNILGYLILKIRYLL